jgi:hypothetical protein
MQTGKERPSQLPGTPHRLLFVVDPHRLVESNFRTIYRITTMG